MPFNESDSLQRAARMLGLDDADHLPIGVANEISCTIKCRQMLVLDEGIELDTIAAICGRHLANQGELVDNDEPEYTEEYQDFAWSEAQVGQPIKTSKGEIGEFVEYKPDTKRVCVTIDGTAKNFSEENVSALFE